MAEDVYGLSESDLRRLQECLRIVESAAIPQPRALRARGAVPGSPALQVILVTSTTTSGGYYPAVWCQYDADSKTWTSKNACWLTSANGETLTAQRYLAICIGSYNGSPLFAVAAATGGFTGTITSPIVTSVTCNNGTLTVTTKTLTLTYQNGLLQSGTIQ